MSRRPQTLEARARARARRGRLRASRLADAARLAMQGLLRPLALRGRAAPPAGGARRLVIVQLDGVSRRRLELALAEGYMPCLAARLAAGGHALSSTRSGAPASTPAFQAGLFYGVSPSVPGYVWFDRRTRREVRMDRADDAALVEARLARGAPGLLRGGTSYFSIFSGGAAFPHFCLSGLAGDYDTGLDWIERHIGPWDALASTLVHSVTAARGAIRIAHEVGAGLVDGVRWSMALGRVKHEARFLAHRVLIGGILRELLVQGILVDVSRGVPVVYTDLIGYDEAAHRRGPGARVALRHLASADAALAMIFAAADAVPELGYDVYVLSDHGHVATRPFEALAGVPLPEFVARAEQGEAAPAVRAVRPNRGIVGGRTLGAGRSDTVAVAEAGDLAHVYFFCDGGPLPLEGLRARHPRALAALAASPAIGIVAARGGRRGLALAGGAVLDLSEPGDVARLPHPQPALAAAYLSDLLSLPESGDLVVVGWRGEGQEVVAYAWEFGSHGGIAPEEIEAFVVHPRDVRFRFDDVVRPSELFRFFEEAYRAPGAGRDRAAVALDEAAGAPPAP
ncbi:MAG TPA: hypothetical protein VFL83_18970 [Anaeromyxobacter sp.]|nr:hypothetical protein [Anaeromyxobacter sp.]